MHLKPPSPGERAEQSRGGEKDPRRPSPQSYREAVSRSGGILFVEKQVTVEEGLQERANRSPCAGLITALRRFCSSSVPAERWSGGRREPRRRFPVSRFFPPPFLAVEFCHIFSVTRWFLKRALPCYKRHARGTRSPAPSEGGPQGSVGLSGGIGPDVQEGSCKEVLLKVCSCRGLGFHKFAPMPASLPALLSLRSQSTL